MLHEWYTYVQKIVFCWHQHFLVLMHPSSLQDHHVGPSHEYPQHQTFYKSWDWISFTFTKCTEPVDEYSLLYSRQLNKTHTTLTSTALLISLNEWMNEWNSCRHGIIATHGQDKQTPDLPSRITPPPQESRTASSQTDTHHIFGLKFHRNLDEITIFSSY